MNWKQKIEAQIAGLRDFEVEGLFGFWVPDETEEAARTLKALLDVAVAAQLLTDSLRVVEEQENPNLSNATKLARQNDALMRLRVALDKLREVE